MTQKKKKKDPITTLHELEKRLKIQERRSKYDDEGDTAPLPPSVNVNFSVSEAKTHLEFRAVVKWGLVSPNTCQADVWWWVIEGKPVTAGGADVDPSGDSGGNNDTSLIRFRGVHNKGQDNPHAIFPCSKPKTWYRTFRVAIIDKAHRRGPWSAWTTPTLPWTGADPKPPAPTYGATPIDFDNKNKSRHDKLRLKFTYNEVVHWDVPGGDHEDDVAAYVVQLDRSDDGTTWDGSPYRTMHIKAKDADGDTTRTTIFHNIRRRYWYRCRVRTVDRYGRQGDWSNWTPAALPYDNNNPPAPTNVETWDLNTDRIPIRWDDPLIDVETRGNSTPTNGSTTVNGVGTKYTNEVREGSVIRFAGSVNLYTVRTVTSDTVLVLMSNYGEATASKKLYIEEDDPDVAYYEWQIAKGSQVTPGTPDVWNAVYDKGRTKGNFVNVKVQDADKINRFYVRVRSIDSAHNRSPWIAAWIRANHGGAANNASASAGDNGGITTPVATDGSPPAS